MLEQLFTIIQDRIKDALPEINWIDLDWGQLEIPEESYPLQFDAVLIDFIDTQWDDLTENCQTGLVSVQFRIAIDMYNDLHVAGGITAPDRELAIEKLKLPVKLHKIIQGFSGDFFTRLVRIRTNSEKREDGLKVFTVVYQTRITDNTAYIDKLQHQVQLKLTVKN